MMLKTLSLAIAIVPLVLLMGSVYAQEDPVLEKDPPSTNASETIQITIRPNDVLPPNGTAIMSTEGANDVDFKQTPPAGITVVIDNQTAIVTNKQVNIETPAPTTAPTAPEESEEEE